METVLSGIRSTGNLHLGNYFGALKNFVRMQHDERCFFFIADYHSLTTHPDPGMLHANVKSVLCEYLAAGLDPDVATIYVQSDVPEVAELSLLLGMHAFVGELERTASFKEKIRKHPDNVNIGLLSYPVLMAADIVQHRATRVPVGKDQEQHLELTRNISLQMGPQIRLLQNNNTMMAEKIQSTIVNTIPLWKNQMVLALGMAHSQQAMQAERAVTDAANELLRKNAATLKQGTIDIAKESERGVVDIETLQQTHRDLLSTLDELNKIRADGKAKRAAAEQELGRIEGELKQKLLELRG